VQQAAVHQSATTLSATTVPDTLPTTGPAGLSGLFAGTGLLGFLGHKVYLRRKLSR